VTRFIRLIESPAPAPPSEATFEFGACSDVGRVRQNNEDFFGAALELNLFVLSDGMGGMSSGEVASRLTVETVLAHCREAESDPRLVMAGPKIAGVTGATRHLASAIHLANRKVREAWQGRGGHAGMGATVIAARCVQERLSLAHVGDSRAYRLRDRRLERLTQDHSLTAEFARRGHVIEENSGSGMQNVLLRAVGMEPEVEVDVSEDLLLAGDTLLLCSDGLTHELPDAKIESVLQTYKDVQAAADHLVDAANQAGGADNVTAIVVRYSAKQTGMFSGLDRLRRRFEI
jgi:PPM family protein phosphatase